MLFAGREVRIEKNCARGLEYGPRPHVPKTEGSVFPNTDTPRPANNVFIIFFRRVLCSSFCVEFSLLPFSNLVYACVWHTGNRKSNQHYTHWRKLRNDFIYYFIRPTKITKFASKSMNCKNVTNWMCKLRHLFSSRPWKICTRVRWGCQMKYSQVLLPLRYTNRTFSRHLCHRLFFGRIFRPLCSMKSWIVDISSSALVSLLVFTMFLFSWRTFSSSG